MAATGFIFDLDGTLWDSHPWYAVVLEQSGRVSASSAASQLKTGANVVVLIRDCGLTKAKFRNECEKIISQLPLYPHVHSVLDALQARGTPLGVATNLPRWLVEPILRGIGLLEYFPVTVYAALKPSGTGLRNAAATLSPGDYHDVCYVGDSNIDALAAERAGIAFAWASYGYGNAAPDGDQAVLAGFDDILEL
jgi:phosphoglycolate phosphatase